MLYEDDQRFIVVVLLAAVGVLGGAMISGSVDTVVAKRPCEKNGCTIQNSEDGQCTYVNAMFKCWKDEEQI